MTTTLVNTPAGELLIPNRLHIRKEGEFLQGTMPSWLFLGTGTEVATDSGSSVAYADPNSATPGATITTATGGNKSASLWGPSFDMALIAAARLSVTLVGGYIASQQTVECGFYSTNGRARARHASDSATAVLQARNNTTGETTYATNETIASGSRHTLTFLVTADKQLYFSRIDPNSFDVHRDASATLQMSDIRPRIATLSQTGHTPAVALKIEKAVLDIWYP